MPKLIVRLDPIVRFRHSGGSGRPDPCDALVFAEHAGADGVLVDFREDQGLTARDLRLMRGMRKTYLVVEVSAWGGALERVLDPSPDRVVLVPDQQVDELVQGEGLSVESRAEEIGETVTRIQEAGVSAWAQIAPEVRDLKAAAKQRLDGVVFDTSRLADARTSEEAIETLESIEHLSIISRKFGMDVAVGGGLTERTLPHVADITEIGEVVIGQAVWARALVVGVERAVSEFCSLAHRA
jgi:pyridoxine 5'-phosphate synthase PdxJ